MQSGGNSPNSGKKHEWIKPINLAVNVITLIVLAIYTWYSRQQVKETQTANSIAQTALVEVNRPYVVWTGFNPTRFIDPVTHDASWRPGSVVTNVGNTPAENATYYNCDPIIRDGVDRPNITCKMSEGWVPGVVIGPRQPYYFNGPKLPDSALDDTRTGRRSVYVFGYIVYKDGEEFSSHKQPKRFTKFCNQVLVPANFDSKMIYAGSGLQLHGQGCGFPDWSCTDSGCKTVPQEAQNDAD